MTDDENMIHPGQEVELKTGGHSMTVERVEFERGHWVAYCYWTDESRHDNPQHHSFPVDMLQPYGGSDAGQR